MHIDKQIPIIDLFAGPGGMGEVAVPAFDVDEGTVAALVV